MAVRVGVGVRVGVHVMSGWMCVMGTSMGVDGIFVNVGVGVLVRSPALISKAGKCCSRSSQADETSNAVSRFLFHEHSRDSHSGWCDRPYPDRG